MSCRSDIETVEKTRAKQRAEILSALLTLQFGNYEEIAYAAGFSSSVVCARRMAELVRAQYVDTFGWNFTKSGRRATVYKLSDQGKNWLRPYAYGHDAEMLGKHI